MRRPYWILLALLSVWMAIPAIARATSDAGQVFEAPPDDVRAGMPSDTPLSGVVATATEVSNATADVAGSLQKGDDWISSVFRAYRSGRWSDGAGLLFSGLLGLLVLKPRVRELLRWEKIPKHWRPWVVVSVAGLLTLASGLASHADAETIVRNTWRAGSSAIAAWELFLKNLLSGKSAPA